MHTRSLAIVQVERKYPIQELLGLEGVHTGAHPSAVWSWGGVEAAGLPPPPPPHPPAIYTDLIFN